MAVKPIRIPRNLAEFISGKNRDDIVRLEKMANALQQQKVQIRVGGTNRIATGTVQFGRDSALIAIEL